MTDHLRGGKPGSSNETNEPSEPCSSRYELVPVGNSLCRGEEKHTMCELDVQIANSGLDVGEALIP